ncbi:helix-turn-helix domain-containing protein [Variovorax sp. J22G21]|uniref:TetR/AcrR family transcriptional regulator n=1 Tax=Variovorax fucosicus TaxID=3053517 RepID=UPI00257562EB|nr:MULTISPECIES: TetR/AcrR family transcriptional regulator [unclassified Variovorax]MDM0042791.1 helix-turn-helix domain-containing protein [Variovorax sp. J22R193]MDM0064814.1 helix-turn-helix domain-containing protein [Variovorax sp. J22G21]
MKVTKAQAQANRARIVETASTLFRERGYDGVGVADISAAAGFTHGGFYRHFPSKSHLMAEAAARGISTTVENTDGVDIAAFFKRYVSRAHRDARGVGCTMAALCGDAARQSDDVKTVFAAGIDTLLEALEHEGAALKDGDRRKFRAEMINALAHAVGAVVLSRACPDDSALADEILKVCRKQIVMELRPVAAG